MKRMRGTFLGESFYLKDSVSDVNNEHVATSQSSRLSDSTAVGSL